MKNLFDMISGAFVDNLLKTLFSIVIFGLISLVTYNLYHSMDLIIIVKWVLLIILLYAAYVYINKD